MGIVEIYVTVAVILFVIAVVRVAYMLGEGYSEDVLILLPAAMLFAAAWPVALTCLAVAYPAYRAGKHKKKQKAE